MKYGKIAVQFHVPRDWDKSNKQELDYKFDILFEQIERHVSVIEGFSEIDVSEEGE